MDVRGVSTQCLGGIESRDHWFRHRFVGVAYV